MNYNERQIEIVKAIAAWQPPETLCGRLQCWSKCIFSDYANGTPMQQEDLINPTITRLAVNCELEGEWKGQTLAIFDMLDELNRASD